MTKPLSFGNIEVGLTVGREDAPAEAESGGPFRVAVLGDFSGRSSRGRIEPGPGIAGRRPLLVDRDNFDEVMARLDVQAHLPLAGGRVVIPFRELDDFHPDRLFQQVEVFEQLRETREKLRNPATFTATAARMRSWAKPEAASSPPAASAPPAPAVSPGNLLDQILGDPTGPAPPPDPARGPVDWNAYLQSVVAPYLTPKADPLQGELLAQVDAATGALLRAVLHHPDLQALEAAWRALFFLVRRLDTDHGLKLFLLDISRDELAADLGAGDDLRSTGLYRLLVEQTVGTPGGQPWALLAGNYTFGPGRADVELLGRLAKVARQAGAPFLAGASPAVLGCRSLAETPDPDAWPGPDAESRENWQALRRLPEAAALGLALPRFLLRLPYGKATDPAEGIDFEELPEEGAHEAYLWGNPAFAWAYLLAETFSRQGWDLRPGSVTEIDGLPVQVVPGDGEAEALPCAEVVLSHRAAEALMERGIMPLLSVRGSDRVRLAGSRSVAEPAQPLAGRWA